MKNKAKGNMLRITVEGDETFDPYHKWNQNLQKGYESITNCCRYCRKKILKAPFYTRRCYMESVRMKTCKPCYTELVSGDSECMCPYCHESVRCKEIDSHIGQVHRMSAPQELMRCIRQVIKESDPQKVLHYRQKINQLEEFLTPD